MTRQVFYSFHYEPDVTRVSQVRNIGKIEANKPAHDNDWEKVSNGGDLAIEKWITDQLKYRSCTVVLIGAHTANRKWINYEIIKSWDSGMGVVGIRIHGLKNILGYTSTAGNNPFDYIGYGDTGKKLSSIVKCYDPTGANSKERYAWISTYLEAAVEEAIDIRKAN
ncbi:MAG: TIR domain-containing protein [Pseudomonadota bacterium]